MADQPDNYSGPRCGECACFFRRYRTQDGTGECRANPPTLFPSGLQRQPKVHPTGWCVNGFKPKGAKP